jgi:hypothetical protein
MMTSLVMPICGYCIHLDRAYKGYGLRCAAFPAGIPDAIIESQIDHREPVDGDQGIRFDPTCERGAEYAAELFGGEGDVRTTEPRPIGRGSVTIRLAPDPSLVRRRGS